MCKDVTNIYFTSIKVDCRDESNFVPANIENDPLVNFVCGWKNRMQFGEVLKICLLCDFIPAGKGTLAVWMAFPKLDQRLAGYDMHKSNISQIEITGKVNFSLAFGGREYL